MFKQLRFIVLFNLIAVIPGFLYSMIDNRFLDPYLLNNGHMQRRGTSYYIGFQPFIMTARSSFGDDEQDHHPLFSYLGNFNQTALNQALLTKGKISQSLIPVEFINALTIPWLMNGHLEIYGAGVNYYQIISKHLSWGFRWAIMHANSRMEMIFDMDSCDKATFIPDEKDIQQLILSKEQMINILGISSGLWQKTSLSDLDIFVRLGSVCDYKYRFRRIDTGIVLGLLAPTAAARNINNPASIPLGGNKQWGMYVSLVADFGLKEDLSAGFFVQVSKRFPRTFCDRLPALNESSLFGVVVENVRCNPGVTVGFSPYIIFEDLRNGLGFRAAYKVVGHVEDSFDSNQLFSQTTFNEQLVRAESSWSSEYVMLGLFYDFAKNKEIRGATPTLSLMWDIPVQFITSHRAFRTHGISLLLETEF
ncbi:MAG: hypothetical protein WA432_02060 [Candidatus Babeliaceae bacterium]